MAVFWVVAPCSLVEVYRRFRGACCLHHQCDRHVKLNAYETPLKKEVTVPGAITWVRKIINDYFYLFQA
jgi:hypothetical protein